jgi:hypothetical protein
MKKKVSGYLSLMIPNIEISKDIIQKATEFRKRVSSAVDGTRKVVFTFAQDYVLVAIDR